MLLREFKQDTRLTAAEIAEMFGITHRQVFYYQTLGAEVEGRKKERRLVLKKVLGVERALEVTG